MSRQPQYQGYTTSQATSHISQNQTLHFEGFFYENLMDFLKTVVTLSVFELGIFSLHQNGIEFLNKLIGTVFSMLVRHV